MIKLYGVALSPFVRKAMLALEHYGLAYENEPTYPGDTAPEFRAISPLGKVPVLQHDDFTVPDTSVLIRYLDRTFAAADGANSLYPQDARQEAQACWLEEYADSRLVENCAGLFRERLLKPKMMNEPTDEARVAEIIDHSLPECLAYLESVVPESGYLVGDRLSVADLAVATCFVQARYGDYEVDGARFPKVRQYVDRAYASELLGRRLASEKESLPPGL